MLINFQVSNKTYWIDSEKGTSIAIPMLFNGAQPNAYGVPPATAEAFAGDGFVLDTRRGGGCNCETYTVTPHCNGTHTECAGHITHERIAVSKVMNNGFIPAALVSVTPVSAPGGESYDPKFEAGDRVITGKLLQKILQLEPAFLEALIIRTMPNDASKLSRNYMEQVPPFFTHEAMRYLVSLNVKHLLVDIPSLDRTFDEGKLSNHHIFWEMKPGSHSTDSVSPKTVTEMIYVPDSIKDGQYLLNLQLSSFISDAAPSRPILFSLH